MQIQGPLSIGKKYINKTKQGKLRKATPTDSTVTRTSNEQQRTNLKLKPKTKKIFLTSGRSWWFETVQQNKKIPPKSGEKTRILAPKNSSRRALCRLNAVNRTLEAKMWLGSKGVGEA